ncbi:MAG: LCP family protein [Candidatus Magasanikbacteria bacterium]|nr:LCP family protein [Candidatus Magasanikbacteria bacterium]
MADQAIPNSDGQPPNLLSPKLPAPGAPRRFWAKRLVYVALLLLVGYSGAYFLDINLSRQSGTHRQVTIGRQRINLLQVVKHFFWRPETSLAGNTEDRINILLLGMGGAGHEGPYLTDTNIIVSLKPSRKEAALISVPRDLGVAITGHGWRRVNNANAIGEAQQKDSGGELARQVFSATFNLSVPYYLRVDFRAVEKLVDALGGLPLDVPRAFTDTQYPGPNESYQTVRFAAGREIMTGERVLQYVRSRHGDSGEGSDFARARRQQLVLLALRDKLLSWGTYLNPVRVQALYAAVAEHLTTNLTFSELMYLGSLAREVPQSPRLLVLDTSPTGYLVDTTGENGAFILAPKSGNFNEINRAIADIFAAAEPAAAGVTGPLSRSAVNTATTTAGLAVLNGTWRLGLAARLSAELRREGFSVTAVDNTAQRPLASTTIYVRDTATAVATLEALSKRLRAPLSTSLPNWLTTEAVTATGSAPGIVVVLGEDFKE